MQLLQLSTPQAPQNDSNCPPLIARNGCRALLPWHTNSPEKSLHATLSSSHPTTVLDSEKIGKDKGRRNKKKHSQFQWQGSQGWPAEWLTAPPTGSGKDRDRGTTFSSHFGWSSRLCNRFIAAVSHRSRGTAILSSLRGGPGWAAQRSR